MHDTCIMNLVYKYVWLVYSIVYVYILSDRIIKFVLYGWCTVFCVCAYISTIQFFTGSGPSINILSVPR